MGCEVEIEGLEEALRDALDERIRSALEVVNSAPQIIRNVASLTNEDVDGNQFPRKQPRPKGDPKNNPDTACVDTGEMFKDSRWTVEETGPTERTLVYEPPEYFTALITKDPERGGRRWLTPDKIADTAIGEIERRMDAAFEGITIS